MPPESKFEQSDIEPSIPEAQQEQKEKIEFSCSFNSETRKRLYPEVSQEDWENPQWQFKNTLKSFNPENQKTVAEFVQKIRDIFQGRLPEEQIVPIERAAKQRKIGVTPYEVSLMKLNEQGSPEATDPIYRQFLAVEDDDNLDLLPKEFASNWERAEEAIAGIAHHKYPDRVIVRLCHTCPATCSFCFERRNILQDVTVDYQEISASKNPHRQFTELAKLSAKIGEIDFKKLGLPVLGKRIITMEDKNEFSLETLQQIWDNHQVLAKIYASSQTFQGKDYDQLVNYLNENPRAFPVKEIILSGGEPMLAFKRLLAAAAIVKQEIRQDTTAKITYVDKQIFRDGSFQEEGYKVRVHTRILTHNPYFLTKERVQELALSGIDTINIHIDHPNEITEEVSQRIKWLQQAGIKVQNQHVFTNGIADNLETQKRLYEIMDELNVPIHHCFHTMGGEVPKHFRTSVEKFILFAKMLMDWRRQEKNRDWLVKDEKGNDVDGDFVLPHQAGKNYNLVKLIKNADLSSDDPNDWFKGANIKFFDKDNQRVISYPYDHKKYDPDKQEWIEVNETVEYPYDKKDDWQELHRQLRSSGQSPPSRGQVRE